MKGKGKERKKGQVVKIINTGKRLMMQKLNDTLKNRERGKGHLGKI